jgi:asparagine synthase (glutamine-hydrolysing)
VSERDRLSMCGIWAYIRLLESGRHNRLELFKDFINLQPRGPNYQSFQQYGDTITLGFTRLSIVDNDLKGNQPFLFEDTSRSILFMANAEIYNYKSLRETYGLDSGTKNDCEVLAHIYYRLLKTGREHTFFDMLKNEIKGEFALIIVEFDSLRNPRKVSVARDEIGIRPLYYHPLYMSNTTKSNALFFTSELKGGLLFDDELIEFPPGALATYRLSEIGGVDVYYQYFDSVYNTVSYHEEYDFHHLKAVERAVVNSVRRRLSADKPLAFLLSGGVDSSLVAAIATKLLGKTVRTFCCGMKGGTDFGFARKVAAHIESNHTEVLFTAEEAIAAIPDVIRTVESWDTTTIRASVAQYLVSQYIGTKTDCRVLLVGEGPDEVCSSYLYNWYAPSADAMDRAAKQSVKNIHYYDVKRADRCVAQWGLEGRVPLLDPEFIKAYWSIPSELRMPAAKGIEKWYLREAFAESGILPDEVLFRKKEALSDGISNSENSWFRIIQYWVETQVTDEEMSLSSKKYPYYSPSTKEAYYYRKVFCSIFGEHRQKVIPGYWQPTWSANGQEVVGYVDPSARVLSVYS